MEEGRDGQERRRGYHHPLYHAKYPVREGDSRSLEALSVASQRHLAPHRPTTLTPDFAFQRLRVPTLSSNTK